MNTASYLRSAILACFSVLGIMVIFAFVPDLSGDSSLAEKFAERWRSSRQDSKPLEMVGCEARPIGWLDRDSAPGVNGQSLAANEIPHVARDWFREAGLPKVELNWVEPSSKAQPNFENLPSVMK